MGGRWGQHAGEVGRRARVLARCHCSSQGLLGTGRAIAKRDLEMRGPGDYKGVKQSGYSDMRIANLIHDSRLIDIAKKDAQEWALMDKLVETSIYSPFGQDDSQTNEVQHRSI